MLRKRIYNRPFVIAAIVSIISTSMLFCVLLWNHTQTANEHRQNQILSMSAFIISVYELYGNWEQVISRLEENGQSTQFIRDRERYLTIWSITNERIWPRNSSLQPDIPQRAKDERHMLLLNGEVIGTFKLSISDQFRFRPSIAISGLFGLFIFAIQYTLLAKRTYVRNGLLRTVASQLQPLAVKATVERTKLNSQQNPMNASGEHNLHSFTNKYERIALNSLSKSEFHSEILMTTITEYIHDIEERLNLLETVRKSMVADVAHELRTPLSVMRSQLENSLNRQRPLDLEQASMLLDEVYRMSKLLSDLQQLSLAESGHLLLSPSWFSLRHLLEDLLEIFSMESEERGIQFELQGSGNFRVYADEERFKQIFMNLIGNALRYAHTSVVIHISFDSDLCKVSVADDGMGMEPEQLDTVFERFYRGTMQRKELFAKNSPGLGLGLPIVKQLIELHAGMIKVSSAWNVGTSFHLQFPIFYDHRQSAKS